MLHIDTGREMRGGQFQVLLLLNALRAAGIEVSLLAREDSPLWKAALAGGFAVTAATLGKLYACSASFDIVHAHDARSHTMAAIAARCPFVVARRVAFPVKRSLLSKWKYRKPERFLAVSEFVAGELQQAGVAAEKIDVVYDAVDPAVGEGKWQPGGLVIALDSADPGKGKDLVTQAAALAGVSVSYSKDLPASFRQAGMFVYISRSEGLGSAALLAMAMGIPVIASDIPGLREAVGDAGLLVPNEAQAIAAAMQKLRDDSALAQTLIERARQRVNGHFTVARMMSGTLAAFERVLAR